MRNNPWNFTTIPLSNDDNDIDNDIDNDNNDDDNDSDNGSDDDDNDNDNDSDNDDDDNDDDGGFPNWTIQFNCFSVSSVGNLKKW